jgi:hypothetical protein
MPLFATLRKAAIPSVIAPAHRATPTPASLLSDETGTLWKKSIIARIDRRPCDR